MIGRRGENDYCKVVFQIGSWLSDWPDGTVQALYWRPDGKMTILASGENGDTIEWVPSRTDMAVAGVGLVEFRLMSGETLGKKEPIFVMILNAPMESDEEPYDENPDWATNTISAVEAAKEAAENAAENARVINNQMNEFWESSKPISPADISALWNKYF